MATAVLDLDFEDLPDSTPELNGYDRALVLIRLRGRPVGQALLPVTDGKIRSGSLREELLLAADSAFWEQWLYNYLGWNNGRPKVSKASPATIAICTRDRPRDLQRCLEALRRFPEDGQELLVVDNCPSTDATRNLVASYEGIRYIREDRPGLNVARNRALREAVNDIIAFTDDDTAPDPGWLRALLRNFGDPKTLCVTGLTMPMELETEAQEWFQRMGGLGRGFKRIVFDGTVCNPLRAWQVGAGVNMALRRDVLEKIGLFDEALDVGTPTLGGGDTEMFSRILGKGYRIVYDPHALNWHRHRSRWKELRRQLYGYELSGSAFWMRMLLCEGDFGAVEEGCLWLRRELRTLARALRRRSGSAPLDIVLARICGAAVGPWAYLYSRWLLQRRKNGSWKNTSPLSV